VKLVVMVSATTVLVLVLALATACGGGGGADDDILHLRGTVITQDEYRTYIHAEFLGPRRSICEGFKGLSAQEIVEAVLATSETPVPLEAPNQTPVSGQVPDMESQLKTAEIITQECERIAD
jgi:hypothetical protein